MIRTNDNLRSLWKKAGFQFAVMETLLSIKSLLEHMHNNKKGGD